MRNKAPKKTTAMIAAHQMASAPSILIILMGSLGDVARGLSLVSHLKANIPDSRINWLVEPKCAELVSLHPQIDKVIIFNRSWRISMILNLYKQLRQDHFDITLDLQRHLKSGFFSMLSKSKRRIGFHRRNSKEMNWVFNNEHIKYYSNKLPKLKHYLKFTEYLGLPEPQSLDFGISSSDLEKTAPRNLTGIRAPFIAVVMGASWQSKEWFIEGYYQLIDHILTSQNMSVVLLGDLSQVMMANRLKEKINNRNVLNLVGKTSLLELVAVLKAAATGIGPDSGPAHLAAAVKTPYVTLFGPTSPVRTAPWGCEHLVVQAAVDCAPCYQKRCPQIDKKCMRQLNFDTILRKLSVALTMNGLNY